MHACVRLHNPARAHPPSPPALPSSPRALHGPCTLTRTPVHACTRVCTRTTTRVHARRSICTLAQPCPCSHSPARSRTALHALPRPRTRACSLVRLHTHACTPHAASQPLSDPASCRPFLPGRLPAGLGSPAAGAPFPGGNLAASARAGKCIYFLIFLFFWTFSAFFPKLFPRESPGSGSPPPLFGLSSGWVRLWLLGSEREEEFGRGLCAPCSGSWRRTKLLRCRSRPLATSLRSFFFFFFFSIKAQTSRFAPDLFPGRLRAAVPWLVRSSGGEFWGEKGFF